MVAPMLAVTRNWRPPISKGASRERSIRDEIAAASAAFSRPTATSAYSSPPSRARVSHSRTQVFSRSPQAVVNGFEAVQIDEKESHHFRLPVGPQQRLLQPVGQKPAVGQAGQ